MLPIAILIIIITSLIHQIINAYKYALMELMAILTQENALNNVRLIGIHLVMSVCHHVVAQINLSIHKQDHV